jgi:hypothetical protein
MTAMTCFSWERIRHNNENVRYREFNNLIRNHSTRYDEIGDHHYKSRSAFQQKYSQAGHNPAAMFDDFARHAQRDIPPERWTPERSECVTSFSGNPFLE